MSDYSSDSESRENESISNPDVVTKYKAAAKIVNDTLAAVIDAAKPGAKIVDLCTLGDKLITEAAAKEFKGKDIEKGIAVPTCVSVNNCIGHFSPPADNTATLKEGDVVKIDLGAHIDGFIAQAAHSLVAVDGPAKGRAADVVAAAHAAYEAASRLVRAGRRAKEVGPVLSKIAEAYGCTLVEGVLSHEMKRFIIDASKAVLPRPGVDQKADDFEIEEGEVYAIDIVMSTGEGKSKVVDEKETTVFKRALDVQYQLKIKASREVLSEINKKFPTMMFSSRGLESTKTRYGLLECINHNLLQPFPVLYEKPDALVAHFKGTVLLVPSGVDRITNSTLQALESDKSIEDAEVKALLATSLKTKKKKKSKGEAPKAVEA
ncbi:hypothetical protein ACKKBG_A02055 [Auxenochlorella protothecoides x Auxenochlorella symbiontica]|uniref:Peptidase M24 domain-containing protein n=1 Tax=Auxenochlorella protothecoides TaxID=3075 RepID=A0A1D1ZZM9_AUXPR